MSAAKAENGAPTLGITGASGFLGSALLEHLQGREPQMPIRALTRTLHFEQVEGFPDVDWFQGDLLSPSDCEEFVGGLDVVVHLAHVNTPLTSDAHLPSDAASNLVPALNLLQAIRDGGRRPHVVLASSGGALYRPAPGGRPFTEDDPCAPPSSYGIQKLALEHYLRAASEQGWLTATVLRIGNPYGVLLPPQRRQGLIGVALNEFLHGQAIRVFGDPRNVRDYVHLDDMCRMFELTLRTHGSFDVYNVGSGVGHSVEEILALLERILDAPLGIEREPVEEAAQRLPSWVVLDVGKAEAKLGWTPSIAFEEGLRRLCAESLAAR